MREGTRVKGCYHGYPYTGIVHHSEPSWEICGAINLFIMLDDDLPLYLLQNRISKRLAIFGFGGSYDTNVTCKVERRPRATPEETKDDG